MIRASLSTHSGCQDEPPVFLSQDDEDCHFDGEVSAGFSGWRVRLRGAASSCPACASCGCDDGRAHGMRAPQAGRHPSSLPPAFVRCDGGFSIRPTRTLPRFHALDLLSKGLSFLGLGGHRGLRLLLGQLTRMHDHTTPGGLRHLP